MRRRCPTCKSLNVRRTARDREALGREPVWRSPYRCRDCGTKFWALGTKMYRRIVLGVIVNVALFAVIVGVILLFEG
jgi:transposase-like protein